MRFGRHVLTYHRRSSADHEMYRITFANGYGASIVRGRYTYGGEHGLWELAVLHGADITYDTPITNDVVGHLEEAGVADLLDRIEALPREED